MKITHQQQTGQTTYYYVEATLNDETKIEATLSAMSDDNCLVPEYELTIIESKRNLTEKELEELEELAILNSQSHE